MQTTRYKFERIYCFRYHPRPVAISRFVLTTVGWSIDSKHSDDYIIKIYIILFLANPTVGIQEYYLPKIIAVAAVYKLSRREKRISKTTAATINQRLDRKMDSTYYNNYTSPRHIIIVLTRKDISKHHN